MKMRFEGAGRYVLALCAVAAVAAVWPSYAAETEAGRYQWSVTAQGEGKSDRIRVIDTYTGEVVRWDSVQLKWALETLPLDWDDIRKQSVGLEERRAAEEERRAEREKQRAEWERQKREAEVEKEAFIKAFAQKSLEEQVAMARDIYIVKVTPSHPSRLMRVPPGARLPVSSRPRPVRVGSVVNWERLEEVKAHGELGEGEKRKYATTDDGVAVLFGVKSGEDTYSIFLSNNGFDNEEIFPAPETIVEDVRAEVKRQAETGRANDAEGD